MPHTTGDGRLISIEGLNGVGKTYLTARVLQAAHDHGQQPPLVIEEFSRRTDNDTDLGRHLLRALVTASRGERFLRAGFPKSETLLLLAIKIHDYEAALPALRAGHTVIEGRSLHSTAVYQSLIMNPDDDEAALTIAEQILHSASGWRPLPDLTIVLTDDVEAAVSRAEARDGVTYTAEQWRLHHRAAALFERLATTDPGHVRLLDRREHDADALVPTIGEWIVAAAARRPFHGLVPATALA
ncbi:MAG: dTMP kinase [Pseudonocardiaceae bacterium]